MIHLPLNLPVQAANKPSQATVYSSMRDGVLKVNCSPDRSTEAPRYSAIYAVLCNCLTQNLWWCRWRNESLVKPVSVSLLSLEQTVCINIVREIQPLRLFFFFLLPPTYFTDLPPPWSSSTGKKREPENSLFLAFLFYMWLTYNLDFYKKIFLF